MAGEDRSAPAQRFRAGVVVAAVAACCVLIAVISSSPATRTTELDEEAALRLAEGKESAAQRRRIAFGGTRMERMVQATQFESKGREEMLGAMQLASPTRERHSEKASISAAKLQADQKIIAGLAPLLAQLEPSQQTPHVSAVAFAAATQSSTAAAGNVHPPKQPGNAETFSSVMHAFANNLHEEALASALPAAASAVATAAPATATAHRQLAMPHAATEEANTKAAVGSQHGQTALELSQAKEALREKTHELQVLTFFALYASTRPFLWH